MIELVIRMIFRTFGRNRQAFDRRYYNAGTVPVMSGNFP
jgi:hypothetical protein